MSEPGPTGRQGPPDGDWFGRARFGLFVHWDHASRQGLELSWPLVGGLFALPKCQSVTRRRLPRSAADVRPAGLGPAWRAGPPRARRRDAVRRVHREAPRRVRDVPDRAAPTTRWPHSPCGSRPRAASSWTAVRAEGLRVGLYFSLSDWHHPDYPAFTDADRPYLPGFSPPRPAAGALGALPRVPARPAPRAADRLRADRRAVVRRRLGAARRRGSPRRSRR